MNKLEIEMYNYRKLRQPEGKVWRELLKETKRKTIKKL